MDTVTAQRNPYELPLSADELAELAQALAPATIHYLLGMFCAASMVPETPSATEGFANLERQGADRERIDTCAVMLTNVYMHVLPHVATEDLEPLIPGASQTDACRDWARGFLSVTNELVHDISEEEGSCCLRLRSMIECDGGLSQLSDDDLRTQYRRGLAADVARLGAIWRAIPVAEDDVLNVEEEPAQARPPGMQAGRSTSVARGPKVGRNDPCPCGSGKKYKKCCGVS